MQKQEKRIAEVLGGGTVKCYHALGSFNRSLHSVILLWCQIMCMAASVLWGRFGVGFNCADRSSGVVSRIKMVFVTGIQFQLNILRRRTLRI